MLKLNKKILIGLLAISVVTFSSCEMLEMLNNGSSTPTVSNSADNDTSNEETNNNPDETEESAEIVSDESPEEIQETTAEPTDEAGGNPEDGNNFSLEVTVSENTYIYDNHEISYDELMEIFDTLTENDIVKLSDDNASLDAYSKLASALEERGLLYINDDGELSGGTETEE